MISAVVIVSCTGESKNCKDSVMEAYELRLDGAVDSARAILEDIVAKDPENALAWYELSRTDHHIAKGDMQNLVAHMENARKNNKQALELEPDNLAFLNNEVNLQSLDLYIKMQQGMDDRSAELNDIETTTLKILSIDPGFYSAKLRLVEMYAMMPPQMGGNTEKAEQFAQELEKEDLVYGAKAREIMMPEDSDFIAFWTNLSEQHEDNPEIIEALGRTYLLFGNAEEAQQCFDKVVELNPKKNCLKLDMGRYYMMQIMQGQMAMDTALPLIVMEFDGYLSSIPEPINVMKAWTLGQKGMLLMRTGNAEEGDMLIAEAERLDPYFPRVFSPPDKYLYVPPDTVVQSFTYLSRPF
jgi:tetratricopeptide (TPR) repeat protein